jgi:hypothetical protein
MAQSITGSTTVDMDQTSGTGTAICETDLDYDAQEFYEAWVYCSVVDSSGNQVAQGQYRDADQSQGYAQVVLTFTATPGVTYTATGDHRAYLNFYADTNGDYDETEEYGYSGYYDPFNFFSFAEGGVQSYPYDYVWYGPGPEEVSHAPLLHAGDTDDSGMVDQVPSGVSRQSDNLITYTGSPGTLCDGTRTSGSTAYGYQHCYTYQILDQINNDIQQVLAVSETINVVATNQSSTINTAGTMSNADGIFSDEVGFVFSTPLAANACTIATQTFTISSNVVRINCVRYSATDVTITNISGGQSCMGTCP